MSDDFTEDMNGGARMLVFVAFGAVVFAAGVLAGLGLALWGMA